MSETPRQRRLPPELEREPDAEALGESWDALAVPTVDGAWEELRAGLARTEAGGEEHPGAEAGLGGAGGAGAASRGEGGVRGTHGRRTRRPWPFGWARAAAVAALLVGGGALVWNAPVEVTAAPGERTAVRLPDGSAAELNAGSTLRYARGFSWLPGWDRGGRQVELEGEAWFQVVADGRSFEVEAGAASVRVLGTAFTVRNRPGHEAPVRVVVEEGRVAVEAPGSVPMELGAGDEASWSPVEGLASGVASQRHALAWRDGGFAAYDAPLGEVLDEAARHFGVSVEAAAGVDTGRRVTIYYGAGVGLERILADVVTAEGLHFRATATGWQVVP